MIGDPALILMKKNASGSTDIKKHLKGTSGVCKTSSNGESLVHDAYNFIGTIIDQNVVIVDFVPLLESAGIWSTACFAITHFKTVVVILTWYSLSYAPVKYLCEHTVD